MSEDSHYHQRQNNRYLYHTWSFINSTASEISFLSFFSLTTENLNFYINTYRDSCSLRSDNRKSRWAWSQWSLFQNEYENEI